MSTTKAFILSAVLTFSAASQAKQTQFYDEHGNPTQCEIESNGLNFVDGLCPHTSDLWYDKYSCVTDNSKEVEIHMNWRFAQVTIYAFEEVFTGTTTDTSRASIPDGLSAYNANAKVYGLERVVFRYVQKNGSLPSSPLYLEVHLNEGRAPWIFEIQCKQLY